MMKDKIYDTLRFKSEQDAGNEIYRVDYQYPQMIVTDPDGKKNILPMEYEPIFGLDVIDLTTLDKYLDQDMNIRNQSDKR